MHSSLTAVVLCIFTQAASAQCLDDAALAREARMGVEVIKTSAVSSAIAAPASPVARQGGELIRTASAGTRDAPGAAREGPAIARNVEDTRDGSDQPRRSGTAMLLAALALMSGIALRRYGANPQ